jgi:predicted nuclease of predicted toxin-antitoxin system
MYFLVDADLPRQTVGVITVCGHQALDSRDVKPPIHFDAEIAEYARVREYGLISCDKGFADTRRYPPNQYHGLVVLRLPDGAPADQKLDLVKRLLGQPAVLAKLPGRLAIVSFKGIRLRPA